MKRFYHLSRLLTFSAVLLGLHFSSSAQITTTFNYSGSVQTYTVPAGILSVVVDAVGAAGGSPYAFSGTDPVTFGGRVQCTLAVTPGQVLYMYVGGAGRNWTSSIHPSGGFNGGGGGGDYAADGGGASDIRTSASGLTYADRLVVAGGGGGGGDFDIPGGAGGGLTGATAGGGACGGGQSGPACATGYVTGSVGDGGTGNIYSIGGGGGGYWGGNAGVYSDGGGGGGSSYTDASLCTGVVHTQGYAGATGNGLVTITTINAAPSFVNGPSQTLNVCQDAGITGINTLLTITDGDVGQLETWSAIAGPYHGSLSGLPDTATSNGSNVTPTGVPVALAYTPATGYAGLDTFIVMADDGSGATTTTTVYVTVHPTPDVAAVTVPALCNNDVTSPINFTGSVSGTTYTWTNSDASIGLANTGTGATIASFTVTNTTTAAVTSTVTVVPSAGGCSGAPMSFTITVNPTPGVSIAPAYQSVCNGGTSAAVTFSDPVTTTYTWNNSDASTGLATSGTGSISSFTVTNTGTDSVTSTITVIPSSSTCTGAAQTFWITAQPTPVLTSTLTPAAICDGSTFTYIPTTLTPGTVFSWVKDTIPGILPGSTFGSGNAIEVLHNTTAAPIPVNYVYTMLAGGCLNTQTVMVTVNPTPMLSSTLTPPAICDSTLFFYAPVFATAGTTHSWVRDTVIGISNSPSAGVDTINEVLVNTTANPLTVNYVYSLSANGCSYTQSVSVAVNPRPTLTSSLTAAICDSTKFVYYPSSGTTGYSFAWHRAAVTGISTPARSGQDTIGEVLVNTTTSPVVVIYKDTLTINGCINIQDLAVTVNPRPTLSSSLTPAAICDSTNFNYPVSSATTGTLFAWSRPFIAGIGNVAAGGTGNPNEQLINNTNVNINVTYVYTLTANGCSNTQNVVVVVHPIPTLSSNLTNTVCSGTKFIYTPTSFTPGVSFAWTRASVTGITPATATGTASSIIETLTDTISTPVTAVYVYSLSIGSCSHKENIKVTVNPAPAVADITTMPNPSQCSNTLFQNFGASMVPPAGSHFTWSATNAYVYATGSTRQYALVNFNQPGTAAVVTLSSTSTTTSCTSSTSYTVNVGTGVSDNLQVIFYRGQFLCLRNDMDAYQWGYDDATTLAPVPFSGEINPNYFEDNPDFGYRYYWVETKHGDCSQKTYYNTPLAVTAVNSGEVGMKVYPNPAKDNVNVEVSAAIDGKLVADIYNIMGQKVTTVVFTNHKASVDVSALAAGAYMVDCTRDGVKIATAKFIKN